MQEWDEPAAHAIEEMLEAFVARAPLEPSLAEAVRYAVGLDSADPAHRGKRVRPALCLLVCESLGGTTARALPAAIACELLHAFLLAHDDIADGDEQRRGRSSVWHRFGLAAGVNAGDVLCALTQHALLTAGYEAEVTLALLRSLDRTLLATGRGQAMDLAARGCALPRHAYEEIALQKTAFYLAFPMHAGALLAGAGAQVLAGLEAFATCLGPMFQISDDLIDMTERKGRGACGNDIREGKCTVLSTVAFERAGAEDRARLLAIMQTPRAATTDDDVAWAMALFGRLDAAREARAMSARLLERAISELTRLPEPLRDRLERVARALFQRQH